MQDFDKKKTLRMEYKCDGKQKVVGKMYHLTQKVVGKM